MSLGLLVGGMTLNISDSKYCIYMCEIDSREGESYSFCFFVFFMDFSVSIHTFFLELLETLVVIILKFVSFLRKAE